MDFGGHDLTVSLGGVFAFFSDYLGVFKSRWSGSGVARLLSRPILHLGSHPVTLAFLAKMTIFLIVLGVVAASPHPLCMSILFLVESKKS